MITPERSITPEGNETSILPDLLGERTYYAQNGEGGRGDVVQLIRPGGARAEANRYSAYGRPYNIMEADVNADGVVDLADLIDFLDDYNPNLSSAHVGLGDFNMDGYVDLSDQLDFLGFWMPDLGVATGRDVLTAGEAGGRAHGGNRKGYAAYEHEPWWYEFTLSGTPPTGVPNAEAGPLMQLARHRFYRADLGTWTRRDPLGYVDGMGLYGYVASNPIVATDSKGLWGLRPIGLPRRDFPCAGLGCGIPLVPGDLPQEEPLPAGPLPPWRQAPPPFSNPAPDIPPDGPGTGRPGEVGVRIEVGGGLACSFGVFKVSADVSVRYGSCICHGINGPCVRPWTEWRVCFSFGVGLGVPGCVPKPIANLGFSSDCPSATDRQVRACAGCSSFGASAQVCYDFDRRSFIYEFNPPGVNAGTGGSLLPSCSVSGKICVRQVEYQPTSCSCINAD